MAKWHTELQIQVKCVKKLIDHYKIIVQSCDQAHLKTVVLIKEAIKLASMG